jgi:protein-S-isoprenylcysteine O-methyltransferase Ste14
MNSNFSQHMHQWLLRARIPASILMVVAIAVFSQPRLESWLIGFVVIVLGELLRIWASGHIHKMAEVTTTGPYALCRHPLYLGHFLIATGFCIAGDSITAFIIVSLSFLLIYMPTWKNEEKNLTEKFGDTYSKFIQTTPALLPHWNSQALNGTFSWEMVKKHREWNHVAILLAAALGMVAFGYLRGSW